MIAIYLIYIMVIYVTMYPLFFQIYLNSYQIPLESVKPPKNRQRNSAKSLKYPEKIDKKSGNRVV